MWTEVFAYLAFPAPFASRRDGNATQRGQDELEQRLGYRRLGSMRRTCRAFDDVVWHSRPEFCARIASVLSQRFLRRSGGEPRRELTRYLAQTAALSLDLPPRALTILVHEPLNALLARAPKLRHLELRGTMQPTLDVAELKLEQVPELEVLRLRGMRLGPSRGAALGVQHLPRLAELELSATGSSPRVGELFATMPSLRRLILLEVGLQARDVALLTWRHLAKLELLDLSENPLGNAGLVALKLDETSWLRQLFLRNVRIGSEVDGARAPGVAFRFDFARNSELRLVDLRDNLLNEHDAKKIGLPAVAKLRGLDLSHNFLRTAGLLQLRYHEAPELRWLEVGHNRINPAFARGLGLHYGDDGSMRWERDHPAKLPTPWTQNFWLWPREALMMYGAVVPV